MNHPQVMDPNHFRPEFAWRNWVCLSNSGWWDKNRAHLPPPHFLPHWQFGPGDQKRHTDTSFTHMNLSFIQGIIVRKHDIGIALHASIIGGISHKYFQSVYAPAIWGLRFSPNIRLISPHNNQEFQPSHNNRDCVGPSKVHPLGSFGYSTPNFSQYFSSNCLLLVWIGVCTNQLA